MSSANSGKSEDFFSRMDCIFDITFVNLVNTWAIDGSGEVREEVVVREETLIWREVNCVWSSFCFDSYIALSILSWAIVDWREAVSSSDADGVAVGSLGRIGLLLVRERSKLRSRRNNDVIHWC